MFLTGIISNFVVSFIKYKKLVFIYIFCVEFSVNIFIEK